MNTKKQNSRIRRRNKCGYTGAGTGHIIDKKGFVQSYTSKKASRGEMGDYNDPEQNHKAADYKAARDRRSRLGYEVPGFKFDEKGNVIGYYKGKNRQYSKKFADNHQRL